MRLEHRGDIRPSDRLFTPTGTLNQARARHTMTLLPNGTVLVAVAALLADLPLPSLPARNL